METKQENAEENVQSRKAKKVAIWAIVSTMLVFVFTTFSILLSICGGGR